MMLSRVLQVAQCLWLGRVLELPFECTATVSVRIPRPRSSPPRTVQGLGRKLRAEGGQVDTPPGIPPSIPPPELLHIWKLDARHDLD